MRKLLTDSFCKAIDPPPSGRVEVADLRCSGLAFRVTSNGARSWAFRFRDPITRRTSRATIGAYPDVGLAAARERADELRIMVAAGTNPVEHRKRVRAEAPSRTFEHLSDRYITEHAKRRKRPRSIEEDERNLKLHVLPKWSDRDYATIARRDVIELVESLVVAGKPVAANRVHSLISAIFNFGIDADLLDANPAARLRKRGVEQKGRRILSDDELRLFWRAVVLPPVSRRVGLALRLAALTGARANEVAGATKSEFSQLNDPSQAVWTIPAPRVKNKRDHLVPLSSLAIEVVRDAIELTDDDDEFLFPSPRVNEGGPIDRHALTTALTRFATKLKGKSGAAKTWRDDPPSPHDLRRTVETRLSSLGIPKEDRDAVLNHKPSGIGQKHYDLYERAKEKRAALEYWSMALADIVNPSVVPIIAVKRGRSA